MGAISRIKSAADLLPPAGLDAYGKFAWHAALEAIGPLRGLTQADLLSLEAACRSWARWKQLEEKIADDATSGDELAGEIVQLDGKAMVTTLRHAADQAFAQWQRIASAFGIAFPALRGKVPEVDLFGMPDRPLRGVRGPGRPAWTPTIVHRNRVRLLLALGWSNPRIAAALEVTLPTLHKYFAPILKERELMRDRLDARRFEVAAEHMNAGSVAGLKELNKMVEASDRAGLARGWQGDGDVDDDQDEESGRSGRNSGAIASDVKRGVRGRRGKKEIQDEEAKEAGGDGTSWGDLLKPGTLQS